jgi:hypothetical protein
MLDADIVGELGFEFGNLRAEDVFAVFDDAVDRLRQAVLDTLALCAKIDELHVGPNICLITRRW